MNIQPKKNVRFTSPSRGYARICLILLLELIFFIQILAQPTWEGGTPNINPTPVGYNMGIQVSEESTIYYIIYNSDAYPTGLPSATIKGRALLGPDGGRVATGFINYTIGNIGSIITEIVEGLQPNQGHTIFISCENTSGQFSSANALRYFISTLACPPIQVTTFFGNIGECVNIGASGMYQVGPLGILPTGVLKGTIWTIDWGDGSEIWTDTSDFADDLPPVQTHLFESITDCNYVGTWTVQNPCGEFLNGSSVFVVHGRDIPLDGDGLIDIVDDATGGGVIEVCEGTESIVVLRDNSTWNCQNPTVPVGLTAAPNDDPRNLQWYYGENPAGGVTNTITGNVAVGSLGNANASGGVWDTRHAPSPMEPGETSDAIIIPATAVAGEYFRVYLKNWNKCNWADPDYVDGYVDIVIIDAPPAPTASDRVICYGEATTLTATSTPEGEHRWFAEASKTTLLHTGDSYSPPVSTSPGSYTYYVADGQTSGDLCEGPTTAVDLLVRNELNYAGPITGDSEVCEDETGITYSVAGAPPLMPFGGATRYVWSVTNGSITTGQYSNNITVTAGSNPWVNMTVSVHLEYTSTPTCGSTPVNRVVDINRLPSGSNSNFGARCSGTTLNIDPQSQGSVTVSGCSFTWTGSNGSSGTGNINDTPINVTAARISIVYTVTPTGPAPSSCPGSTFTITVQVDPNPISGTLTAIDDNVCDGEGIQFSLTGYVATRVRLYMDPEGTGGWRAVRNAQTPSGDPYIVNFPATDGDYPDPGTHEFRLWVDYRTCSATLTNNVSVTIDPTTVGGSVDPGRTVCEGSNSGLLTLSGHVGDVQNWQVSSNSGSTWSNIANTNTTYTSGALNTPDTYWYRAVVRSGECDTEYSDYAVVTVNPATVGGSVTPNRSVCEGSNSGLLSLGGQTGSVLRWQVSSNGGGSWSNISNTGTTYTSGALNTPGTYWYRAVVQSGVCSQEFSNHAVIIVEPELSAGTIAGDQSLCFGDDAAVITSTVPASGGLVPRSYLWYHATAIGGPYSPAIGTNTNPNYNPGVLAVGNHYYYREVISSGVCPTAQTGTALIIINPGPAVQTQTITGANNRCENQTITLNYAAVTDATSYVWNFDWVADDVNATTAGPSITIDLSSYTFTSPSEVIRVRAAGVNGCNVDSDIATGDYPWSAQHAITVYDNPVAAAGSDDDVCGSQVIALAAVPTVGIGTWSDLGTGPGSVGFSDQNLATAVATATRYGTYSLQWEEDNGGCTDADNVLVTYYEQPNVTAPANFEVCDALTTTLTGTGHSYEAGSDHSETFLWEYVSGPDNTPVFGAPNAITTSITVDFYGVYVFRVTETNGTCYDSNTVQVTFSEEPSDADAGTNINVACDALSVNLGGTAHSYLGGSNIDAGTRTWTYVSGPDNTPTFTDATNPITQVSVNDFGNYVFEWTEENGTCTVSDQVTVRFFEDPDGIVGSGPYIADCDDKVDNISVTAHSYIGAAATHPESTREWSYFSGPDNTPVFSAPNSPTTNVTVDNYGTYVFRWTETNGTCSNSTDVTVTYNENPSAASAGGNLTSICDSRSINLAGTAHTYELAPSTHTGSTRGWTWISGPDNTPSFTSPSSPTSEVVVDYYGTYVFEWTETNGNCSVSDQVTVSFYENPSAASAGGDITATCNSYSTTLDGTGHTYEGGLNDHSTSTRIWTWVSGPDNTPSFTDATDPKTDVQVDYYGTYVFEWTETNGNCSRSDQVTVSFHENPVDASAGADITGTCGSLTEALGGTAHGYDGLPNDHSLSTRTWAYVSGPDNTPAFADITDATSDVTVDQYGVYEFSWTETNGNCSVSETITATFYETPSVSVDAVADVCRDSSLAIIPISGDFGGGASSATWTVFSGDGIIQNQNTVGNTVTAEFVPAYNDIDNGSVTLRLSTNDPTGPCTQVSDDLVINIDEAVYVVIHEAPQIFIAEGTSASITSTISGAGGAVTTGVWTELGALTGGTFAPSPVSNNISFTPTAAQEAVGGVTLRLTSADPGTSCGPTIAEIQILIGVNPIADAGPDIEDCEPADGLLHLEGWAKASAGDADWSVVTGNGTIISQVKTWSVPQSAPDHDDDDSLFIEAVYQLDATDYGTPSTQDILSFRLTTDDPDAGGPVSAASDDMNYTVQWGPHTPAIGGGGLANMCTGALGQFYSVPLTPGNTYVWTVEALSGGVAGTDYSVVAGGSGHNFIAIDWFTEGTYNLRVTETTYLSDMTTPCVGDEVIMPIAVYPEPVVSLGPDATICLGETHTMSSTVTDGSGSYLYEWIPSTGLSAADIPNPVVTGTFIGDISYYLKVTDLVSGCETLSSTVTITTNPLPVQYTLTGPEYYCFGAATGVTLTLSDSELDVFYQLMNGAVPVGGAVLGTGSSLTWTNNFDGSYFVAATRDAVPACTETMAGVVNVSANPQVTMSTDLIVPVACFGSNEGIIEITPGGGTAPYTFLWSGPGVFSSTNEDISGLYAGDYTVTITDARGCSMVSAPITISQPAQLALTSVLQTQAVTCFGGSDGDAEVVVDAATGTAPYTFQWYYDMSLSSPVVGATTSTLVDVPAAIYYVLVSDLNSCNVSGSVVITEPAEITGSGAETTPVSCNGESDAVITITAAGGSGSFEYDLNNADAWQGANTFGSLGAGTYSLRVRDALATSCVVSLADVIITEPDLLTVSGNVTSNYNGAEISCPTATDGIISLTGSGGTPPYQYNIDGGAYQAGPAFGSLGAGTYTMGIIDSRGCESTVPVTITAPAAISGTATATSNYTGFNVSCNGASDGILEVSASNGTGTLQYSLDGGAYQVSDIFTGLAAGSYDITVRDANGCTFDILNVPLTEPAAVVASAIVSSDFNGRDISCNGESDGEVTASALGGTGVYTYQWFYDAALSSAVPGGTADVLANQPAGTYWVQVLDENGCTDNTSITINSTPVLVITPTADVLLTCNGDSDAAGTFTISGGTAPYGIVVDANTSGATTVATAGDLSFTLGSAGVVTITVTDVNGCSETSTITITEPMAVTASGAVTSDYNGSDVSCFGSSNGIIEVTASGGTGALSYVLNEIPGNTSGAITGIFSGLPSGNYTFTVTDANGCSTVTAAVAVTDPVQLTATAAITSDYNGSEVSCFGSADGEITVTAAGGTGILTYTLVEQPGNTTGASSGIFTGVPAGSYTINVVDVNSCNVVTVPVVIDNPVAVTGTAAVTSDYNGSDVRCNGASDGIITVTAAGGTGALTYILNQDPANVTGAASGVFTGVAAGIYTITITDLNGCNTTTASVVISNPPALSATTSITSNYNGSHVSCNGASDGEITVSAFGGTGALSYELVEIPANVSGATTGVFTGLPSGSYTVLVSDLNSCNVTTAAVTVNDPVAITVTAAVTSDYNGSEVSCFGASDGRITVTASGGTGSLVYSIVELPLNISGANTGIFSGVPSGTYTIRATDQNSCSEISAAVTVDDPPAVTATAAITSDYNGSEVSCNGAADGEITVTAAGGTGTLIYSLVEAPGNLTGASTGIYTGVPAGSYTIRVIDVNGCNVITAPVVIDNPPAITATGLVSSNYNGSDVSCFGSADGAITITAAGGTGTLTYVLDQDAANVTGATSGIFTGLNAGNYTVTVTDENGCYETTANITVNNPPAVTASAAVTSTFNGSHISCNGEADGELTVTASGGTGTLSYVLDQDAANVTGAVSGVFTGLVAGTYTVTVTDENGCNVTTIAVDVNEPALITASGAVTSDYNGSDVSCFGSSNGIIEVTASGGTGALSYVLNEIPGNTTGAITGIFSGLPSGNYTFTVTDANGCSTVTAAVAVTDPAQLTATAAITSDYNGSEVSCFGSSDGEITVTAAGGTGLLTYTLVEQPGNTTGASSGIFTGVPAGSYTINVVDVNSCNVVTVPVVIDNPVAVTATAAVTSDYNGSDVSCNGASDGIITVTAAGGTGALSYILNQDPANVTGAASGVFTGVAAGIYTITITDLNGCNTTTASVVISNPPALSATTSITSNYNGSHVSCNGASDGEITVSAFGGTGALSYELVEIPANVSGATTGVFTGLPSGSYTVLVSDLNSCNVTTAAVTVNDPVAITVTAAVTSDYNGSEVSCFGASDGRITVTASGGTGSLVYSIVELPLNISGANTGIFSGVPSGTYTIRATDQNSCSEISAAVTVDDPPAVTATAAITSDYNGSEVSCNGAADGEITVTAAGGTGTLIYSLVEAPGNLTGASTGIYTGVPAGSYTIRVIDVNGCNVITAPVVIDNPPAITATGLVSSNYNGSDVSCFGSADGAITITAAGGTGTLTYVLDQDAANVTGATSGIFTGLNAGNYTVTVTDENGCYETTANITVNNPPAVTASAAVTSTFNGSHISCNGEADGELTVTASGGTGTLSYVLDQDAANVTGAVSGVFTGLVAGTYTVTVTDENGCNVTTIAVDVNEPALITASGAVTSDYNGSDVSCFGSSNGIIEVTASGGTGALSYVLNEIPANTTGAITGIFSGLPSGNYTFTVTDVNGCNTVTAAVAVTDPVQLTATAAITSDYNGSEVSCFGSSDGEITVTAAGGTGLLTYTLIEQPGNTTGAASGIFTGVPAGSYTINVVDVNSCNVVTVPVVIDNPVAVTGTAAVTSDYNGSDVSCNGASDGIITVTAAGGTGALTYILNQDPANVTGAASGVFTGVAAGIYTITITDLNGCNTTTASVVISNPPALSATTSITSNYNGSHVSCNGASDGEITVSAFGGTGALSYELVEIPANVSGATTGVFTGLPSGSYTVLVSDLNSCNVTTAAVTVNDPVAITVTAAVTSDYNGSEVSCFGASDGRITVTASGGTGSLVYSIVELPLNISGANTGIFSGVPSGTYTIRATDQNSCSEISAAVTVDDPPAVTATAAITSDYNGSEVSCNGAADGEITVTAAGGTGTLIYSLVEAPGNLTGASTGIYTGVPAGSYTIRVIDVNGCNVITAPVVIDNPPAITATGLVSSNYNGSDVSCFGSADGAITITAAGGTGTLTYVLDQDAANVTGATSGIFTGLNAGNYTVTVTDENGCYETTANITVNNPPAVTASAAVTSTFNGSHISCNGEADGELTVTASGGTGTLSYVLDQDAANVTGAVSGVFTGLVAGTYTVTVTDENGCNVTTIAVDVNEPALITASGAVTSDYNGSDVSCFGSSNGIIEVTASGGTGALSYVLNEIPANTTGAITGIFSGLPSGNYTFTVTDVNGCNTVTAAVAVTDPVQLTVSAAVTSDYNGEDVSCNGATDGQLTATALDGTGSYSYAWYSDAALSTPIGQTNYIASGLGAGTYWVEVTDLNGCTATANATVTEPVALSLSVAVSSTYNGADISCNGAADGAITATPADGTGPYSYVWYSNAAMTISIGQSTATAVNLTAGTYYVRVFDANGCLITGSATLTDPPALTLSIGIDSDFSGSAISCNGELDGEVTASVGGGTGIYSYEWYDDAGLSSAIGQSTATATGLGAGEYWVEVTDENSCTISGSIVLSEPDVVTVSAAVSSNHNGSQISCFGALDGEVTATPAGGTGGYFYAWYDDAGLSSPIGQTTITATGLGAGTYWVEVSDANGCSETASVTLFDPAPLTVTAAVNSDYNGADISCNGFADGAVLATPAGGTGTYTYAWYDDIGLSSAIGQTTPSATGLTAGTYWVEVTDLNGCTAPASVVVTEPPALSLSLAVTSDYNGEDISCNGAADGEITATVGGGLGTYYYNWYTDAGYSVPLGQFTAVVINVPAGDYYVRVTDINGCEILGNISLTEPVALDATETARTDVSCFGGADGAVTVEVTAGTGIAPYQFSMNGGATWQGTGSFSSLSAGNYVVLVEDANGCSFPVNVTITQPTPLTASISSITHVSCNGLGDGIVDVEATVGSGTAPYQYSIDGGGTWQGTGVFGTLPAGDYTITVEDALGCSIGVPVTITEPLLLELNPTADVILSCFGDANGTGAFYALGGTLNYSFSEVSNTAGATLAAPGFNSQSIFAAGAGEVTVRVTDANGCEAEASITFTQPAPLSGGTIGMDQVICFEEDPAPITELTPAAGGPAGGYSYQWQMSSNPGGPYANIPGETGLDYDPSAGLASTSYYRREVRAGICAAEYSDTIEIAVNPLPSGLLTGGETICAGETSILEVALGTGLPPYELDIENLGIVTNFESGDDIPVSPVVTTTYRLLRITDSNGCEVNDPSGYLNGSATVTVRDLPVITDDPTDVSTCEYGMVTFDATATGDDLVYSWEVYDGSTWSEVMNGGVYTGATSTTLTIFSAVRGMNAYQYRMLASTCGTTETTAVANLFVQTAPEITEQPVDTTICEGMNATFTVADTGDVVSYRWFVDDGTTTTEIVDAGIYSGQGTNTLQLTGADRSYHRYRYYVRIEGTCSPWTQSNIVFLNVNNPPEITTEPVDNVLCEYTNAIFQVQATGEGLSYQWQESTDNGTTWNDLSDAGLYVGSESSRLTIFSVGRAMNENLYRVNISGTCGTPVQSAEVEMSVQTAPEILEQPVTLSVCENMPAGFGIDAQGTGISYQWMVHEGTTFRNIDVSEAEYSGADSDSLTLLSAQLGQSGYRYMVVVSGVCPSAATSDVAIMMVEPNPVITVQPESDAVCENGAVLFTAGSSGPAGMAYQWYVDRDDSNGFVATSDSDGVHMGSNSEQLSISNATVDMDGWVYHLEVSTSCMPVLTNDVTLTVWDNPVPAITPLSSHPYYPLICGGEVLTLDASPAGGSGSYTAHQWSGAIGPLSATNVQVVDFKTRIKGQYALAYAVTDSRGCVGTDVVTIENERPTAQYSSDALPSCGYIDVNFSNQSSAEATSFLWNFADGTTSTDRDVTHGFDNMRPDGQVAYYNIFMEAISDHDCRDTARSVVTIYPKVVAVIDADPITGCQPLNVTFLSTPGAGSYRWDFGDGSAPLDGGYVAYHMYENFGTAAVVRTVELTTTSFYGCTDTETVDINVEPIPAPNFIATPMVQTYPDATVSFSNQTSDGPWTYRWDFGDGSSSTEENPDHSYAEPGTFMVTFYVNNGDCIDSTGTSVVIHPRVPVAAFAEPQSGCTPLEIQFVNESQWATNYLWDFGDGYVSTKENPSHTFYDPGEVTVRLQVNGPGGSEMTSWNLNVYETPNVAFNSAPDSVFVKDKPVRFFNLTSGATDYQWDFGDYYEDGEAAPLNFSNSADTLHVYYTEGVKDVKLIAWNDYCIDSLVLPAVKVLEAGDIQFPNVFRPDPSGPSGGIIDPNNPNLDPGTANSIFFPGVNKQVEEYHLYVYNRWGELIFQSHDINQGWDGYIKGTLAAQGVYLWKVTVVYKNGSPDSMAGDITLLWKREQ
jgi:PKD domain/Ig-like domain CHU_C associated/PKD-like domain/SprB repeat/CHU_C Type IX secretion signal domain